MNGGKELPCENAFGSSIYLETKSLKESDLSLFSFSWIPAIWALIKLHKGAASRERSGEVIHSLAYCYKRV